MEKRRPEPDFGDELHVDELEVDPAVAADIEAQGMEYRWVDAARLDFNSGFHKRGWQAYSVPKELTLEKQKLWGSDPTGVVRRGSLVLAVRKTEIGDLHRKSNDIKRARYNRYTQQSINELEREANRRGIATVRPSDDE